MNPGCFIRAAGASLIALIICGCETFPEGPFPRATEVGWWNDEGASGPAKIVVHVGEQKAYFYKGKTLIGETTVSTGKPGFSTPPGHYTVLSKDAGHVSTVFGDYVMHQGYVPPFAASHGCIRLPGQMAIRFFEEAPVGTPVTVGE